MECLRFNITSVSGGVQKEAVIQVSMGYTADAVPGVA